MYTRYDRINRPLPMINLHIEVDLPRSNIPGIVMFPRRDPSFRPVT